MGGYRFVEQYLLIAGGNANIALTLQMVIKRGNLQGQLSRDF